MRFSVSSGIRISPRTLSQNEKHPYRAFLAGPRINSIMKKLYTIIFGLVLYFGLVEPVFGATLLNSGSEPGVMRVSGFSITEAIETGTARSVLYKVFSNDGSQSHQFILQDAGGDMDCASVPTTLATLGASGTTTLSELLVGTECNLTQGVEYGARITDGASNPQIAGLPSGTTIWSLSTEENVYTELDRTRFVLITSPEEDEIVATSTAVTFSSYIYVNQADIGEDIITSDWYVDLTVRYNGDDQLAVANRGLTQKTIRIPYDFVATYNSVSTTTMDFDIGGSPPREGRYTITWQLKRPSTLATISSFFGLDAYFNAGVLASDVTHFVVGGLTPYDEYMTSLEDGISNSFASTTLATLSQRLGTCNPLGGNFSMLDCVVGLFTLDSQSSSTLVEQFRTMIATRAPLGYATRVVDIFTAETATSSLPVISYTFATSSPLGPETIEFDMQEIFTDADSLMRVDLVSEKTGDNLWEIIMPFVNALLYAILFYKIYKDITGINHQKIR